MTIKTKFIYTCQNCGAKSAKWAGQCGDCGAWNSLIEDIAIKSNPRFSGYAAAASNNVTLLADVDFSDSPRLPTQIGELDRVLGGGIVIGSVILVGGDPGIGKSTLLLQALCQLSITHKANSHARQAFRVTTR